MTTRKELFKRILEYMPHDQEVVDMCSEYIRQLSKPKNHHGERASKEYREFQKKVVKWSEEYYEPFTAYEMSCWKSDYPGQYSVQRMQRALGDLVKLGLLKECGKKDGKATLYCLVRD